MHRNTLWVIVLLGIIAAIVTGVNLGSKTPSSQLQEQTPAPGPKLISQETCNISFSYPEILTKIDIETGGMTLIDMEKEDQSIIVLCQKDIPRVPLPSEKIETIPIGTISAELYHDTSAKDGTPMDKLIFTHPSTKKDVYIAGYGQTYSNFIKTIKIK